MKIGILGGTFDPIHLGHLILAETAYDAAGLDRVILMPTGRSYFKDGQNVTGPETRLAMTCCAAADTDHFEASGLETTRPGRTYTADTLEALRAQYPEDELYYIVGADTLVQMRSWYCPEKVFALAHILVATRADETDPAALDAEMRGLASDYDARITLLPVRNIEISSTDIRERVSDCRSIHYLVPQAVEAYIRENGLYRV